MRTLTLAARNSVLRALPALAWMGVIFFLSAQQQLATDLGFGDLALRKLAHMTEYLILTLLVVWALRPSVARPIAVAMAISILYAASDELHQTKVDGRHGTPIDLIFDGAGILIAGGLIARYDRQRPTA